MAAKEQGAAAGGLPLALLADPLVEAVAVCREGRVVWANARLREWLGRQDLTDTPFDALFVGHSRPAPGRAVACWLHQAGAERRVEVRGVTAPTGEAVYAIHDTTHVKSLEEELLRRGKELSDLRGELERLRARARSESQEREELLTVVAHELRTPATVINGYNRLLLGEQVGPLNEEQRRFLTESTRSCQRLNAFIGNLLEASRAVAGDFPLQLRDASLAPTLEAISAFLKPLLEARDLSIAVELALDAPPVRFDAVRVEQVLTNLVTNAIQYAPPGSTIEVMGRGVELDGCPFLEVAVRDDGPGVAPEDRDRIFLPYVRSGANRSAGGLGLGLAICKRIVEGHGGTIGVDADEASRFWFTLPAAPTGAEGEVA